MRIAIMADTHNHSGRMKRAAERLRADDIHLLLHAGDLTSAAVLTCLEGFELWLAAGNMDEIGLEEAVSQLWGAGRYADFHQLTLEGRAIALLHGHDAARLQQAIHSGRYAYVIHGHTHRRRDERLGGTRIINPGSLARPMDLNDPGYAVLDLSTDDLWYVGIP